MRLLALMRTMLMAGQFHGGHGAREHVVGQVCYLRHMPQVSFCCLCRMLAGVISVEMYGQLNPGHTACCKHCMPDLPHDLAALADATKVHKVLASMLQHPKV